MPKSKYLTYTRITHIWMITHIGVSHTQHIRSICESVGLHLCNWHTSSDLSRCDIIFIDTRVFLIIYYNTRFTPLCIFLYWNCNHTHTHTPTQLYAPHISIHFDIRLLSRKMKYMHTHTHTQPYILFLHIAVSAHTHTLHEEFSISHIHVSFLLKICESQNIFFCAVSFSHT